MSCTGQRLPYSKLNVSSIKGLNLCPLQQQRLSVTSTLGIDVYFSSDYRVLLSKCLLVPWQNDHS